MSAARRWPTPEATNDHTRPSYPAYVWGLTLGANNPTSESWEKARNGNNPRGDCPDLNPCGVAENAPF